MLHLIATPIGDLDEITIKALEVLRQVEIVICESTKETGRLLRHHQISGKKYELLNEHSTPDDVKRLAELAKEFDVALVSDCGTPGFCDPGSDLVTLCRNKSIPVKNHLGPSSLMGLISLSGLKFSEFVFKGFLSQESELRETQLKNLVKEMTQFQRPFVLMDTPYRFQRTLSDLEKFFPQNILVLAMNLATPEELVLKGTASQLLYNQLPKKAEFILFLTPDKY